MQHIAFFRNVNQGQRGHPGTDELVASIEAAGGTGVFAFQSNGTLVFEAEDGAEVARRLEREVFIRPADFLQPLLRYEGMPASSRLELTLFDPESELVGGDALALATRRGRCEIVERGAGWALVLNHIEHQSNGTPVVERVIGSAATSRGLPTLLRLAHRLDGRYPYA